jgi:NAD-dependent dihydropyrimidine dehydrogenase PreA subunit
MSHIIGKACIDCVDTSCVKVCPVDCIHGPIRNDDSAVDANKLTEEEKKGKQLYINPIDCIECGACVPECPVDAIYSSERMAKDLGDEESIQKNYGFFGLTFN